MISTKSEILAIFNKYKNTFKNFIDNLNIKPLDISKQVEKELCNILCNFEILLTKFELDNNLSNKS